MTTKIKQTEEVSLEDIKREASESARASHDLGNSIQLIIFKLGGEEYALPIDQIKEVVITPSIAKIPHTQDYVKGVANIRGTIISIMDLEERFKLTGKNEENRRSFNYTLVIESENHRVGILVKEVPNTLSVLENEIDRSSGIMQYSSLDEDCIDGIVKCDERLIVLIDFFKMMQSEDISATAA